MAPTKRKRGERSSFDASESRPSPHRPGNTNLGQYDRGDVRDPNARRPSRGGQGGQGVGRGRRIEGRESNMNNRHMTTTKATATPSPMSPPQRPTSATQPPTPTTEMEVDEEPKLDPAPFDYEFITPDRLSSWDTTGRQEVIAAGIQAHIDENVSDLAIIFQELIRATLDIRIDASSAGTCVKEILEPQSSSADRNASAFDAETLFIDTLSIVCEAEPGLYEPGKFSQALRPFTVATSVSPTSLRQKLDALLLQHLGLTRDTFIRVGIRQATHLLYRQANYNLLREETEGYSKLVTELFTISGSEPPSAEVVEDAFEKVKGLIGTFDLDVGRVLDITLDVFAAVLIKHYRFFIKLLRVSSWWPRSGESENGGVARCDGLPTWALPSSAGWMPTDEDEEESRHQRRMRDAEFWDRAREVGLNAFFELGGRQVVSPEAKQTIFNEEANDADLDADRLWIEGTGTYPPLGNRTAAQLLGFKLRFYTSEARDKTDILPANLIYLAALLIKIGFLSLRDLYPHLWPLDEDMEKVREAKRKEHEEKERQNRPGGAANALMLAGALVDDTLPNGGRPRETASAKPEPVAKTAEVEDNDKLDEPMDQKVQLLICLLTIGAIPESLFILGRFPWLPEAYPELLDLIHRILHHSIKDVYNLSRPIPDEDFECPTKQVADPDQSGVPKGQVRSIPTPVRKQLRWPFPDRIDTNEGTSYRFYWDEWADNVPVCQSVDDIFTLCSTLLNYSGVCIGRDASLLSKFARIGAQSLATDSSKHNLDRWQDLLKRLLVPALSFTKSNTHVVNEIYDMLRYYPVSIRYSIYAEWFEGQTSRLPAMKIAFARARLETLATMKRISMTNIAIMARSLAKTAYASPGVVFSVALSQIEAYTNLTEVVVECAKYFSDLGYDILVWSLMSSLGGKDRNRTNSEYALLPSRWLLALSRFSGKVFRRYSIMNLSPILQYVNDQLYRGNSTDLVILKELIAQMAGVVPDTDFTDAQLTAMTGGKVLRKQTLINLQDKRYESVKTAKRLMKALTETRLAGQLLISIAQHRQSAIYSISDDEAHIKLLATMIDDTQMILFQYLDLLCSNLDADEFDSHVPGIPELLTDFGLEPALAFMIGRAGLAERMSNIASPTLNGAAEGLATLPAPSPGKTDPDGDSSMDIDGEAQGSGDLNTSAEPHVNGVIITKAEDMQIAELKESTPPPTTTVDTTSSPSNVFHEVIAPIIDTVRGMHSEDSWRAISPEFYVTFWTAALPDLSIPKDSYEKEILRIAEEQKLIMKDRSDMIRPGVPVPRKEETRKALDETRAALISEFGKQVGAYRQRRSRLLKGKAMWFESSAKPDVVSDAILERCLIPRLLLSPSDADFCFKMIKFLHDNSTPNFRTLSLYGRLFRANRLRSIIFACTVREAENLGRFLRLVLAEFARWHADAAVYEKEAWGVNKNLPGFAKALEPDGKPKALFEYDAKQGIGFKALLLTWHRALNSALRDCLDGREWMHIRNAITILKSVVEVFPAIDFMGNGFMKQLEVITKREKDVREDLSLTGNAVLVQLKKKSNSWVMVQAFGSNVAGQANGSVKATPPTKASALKPTAPEFKPQSQASSTGASTPKRVSAAEVEDGEVDDSKSGTAETPAKPTITGTAASEDKTSESVTTPPAETRKSEVLVRREQILREKEAARAAGATSIPPRPEMPRSFPPDRSYNLPSRPEAPMPGRGQLERHPLRHGDRRDGRDLRLPDSGRLDRPGDRPPPREYKGNDRRVPDPPRDFGRPTDRDRDRARPEPPPRWTGEFTRENQDRPGARGSDQSGRLSREGGMPPPRISSDRGYPASSEKQPPAIAERQEFINPERAGIISGTNTPPRSDSPRGRDEGRDRSRPQSPRRYASDRDHQDSRHDDRPNRNGPTDGYSSRTRQDELQAPPAGPRSDRPSDRAGERSSSDRSRDAFQPTQPLPRAIDPNHGRLNSSSRQQPDPNFGRLNAAPASDIPLGPRDKNPRASRMTGAPQPRRDGPRPPTPPDGSVPTGPSSTRYSGRRSTSGQVDASSTPSTPPITAPVGVHPDRLKHLGPAGTAATAAEQPSVPSEASPAGIHPDRLKAFADDGSSSPGGSRPRPPPSSVVTQGPPSRPRGSQPSPVSAGGSGLPAPTGPASATERARGGRRQLAGINTMLQQAGQQNVPERMNVRGRGARLASDSQQFSGPPTPVGSAPPGPPQGSRPDSSHDLMNPPRADLITGNAPNDLRDIRGRRSERPIRHARRDSQSPGGADRIRDSKRGPVDDERDAGYRGYREPKDRSRNEDGRPGRDGSRDVMLGGRDTDRERDREREPSGRRSDVRDREGHDAPWGSGGRGRERDLRGDERRDTRGPRDDGSMGRKRRSEEGVMDRGHDKRPRR